jgi:hypothetical protein
VLVPSLASYAYTGTSSWGDLVVLIAAVLLVTLLVGAKRYRDGRSDPGPHRADPTGPQLEEAIRLTFRRDHVGIARGDAALLADSFAPGEWPVRAGLAQGVQMDDGVSGARIRTLLTDRRLLLIGASPTRRAPGHKTIALDLDQVASVSALTANQFTVSMANGHSLELRVYGGAQPLLRRTGTALYDSLRAARAA